LQDSTREETQQEAGNRKRTVYCFRGQPLVLLSIQAVLPEKTPVNMLLISRGDPCGRLRAGTKPAPVHKRGRLCYQPWIIQRRAKLDAGIPVSLILTIPCCDTLSRFLQCTIILDCRVASRRIPLTWPLPRWGEECKREILLFYK
jgi:hypothetical protein